MSADNGIYILKTVSHFQKIKAGVFKNLFEETIPHYRVAHLQAIDNLDYYLKNAPYNLGAFVYESWKRSPVFETEAEALEYAKNLADKQDVLEYGIQSIDMAKITGQEFVFYGD